MTISTITFENGLIITSDLGSGWDDTIRSLESLDYSSIGGNPFGQYPKDLFGENLSQVDLRMANLGETTLGHNISVAYGQTEVRFFAGGENVAAGIDQIMLNRDEIKRNERTTVIVHELLHESSQVTKNTINIANLVLSEIESLGINVDPNMPDYYQAVEHVVINSLMRNFTESNSIGGYNFEGYSNLCANEAFASLGLIEKIKNENGDTIGYGEYTGADFSADIEFIWQSMVSNVNQINEATFGTFGADYNSQMQQVFSGENGNVLFYQNEQGNTVYTPEGSYYTENMLNLYGKEKVDSDGNVTASMTLGGTLRALADWLGFDGEFGIQGGFAKDDEGSDKEPVDAAKPVVLDMDGDGIEVSLDYQASFDYDGDGFRERTAWISADDAFLVVDLNADGSFGAGDGKIDQRKELVLSDWGSAED